MNLTRFSLAAVLLFATGEGPLHSTETPAPTPGQTADPRQQMNQEIATLRTALSLMQLSRAKQTDEQIATTRKLYDDLIEHFPNEPEPHAAFGEYLLLIGRNEEAFQQWSIGLQLDPQRADILAAQSDLLLQTGQIVAAADAMEKAAQLEPKNASHLYGLAHIYTLFRRDLMASRHLSEDEMITRGTEYFRQAAELAPENLIYAKAYAETFYTQPRPDWKLARTAWESLLARSSEKDFIHTQLVRINLQLRDKAAANAHLAALTDPAFASVKAKLQRQVDQL
ncbi:MAG: hypothetical protein ABIT76_06810 [Chthoniobacterales bacterium]